MISIIDFGAGNLKSVKSALDCLNAGSRITNRPDEIAKAERLILPGDGSFGFMMKELRKKKLIGPIKDFIRSGKPFLGICLGLQVLFEESEESPGVKGFGVFRGKVVKFKKGKVPQIGWNKTAPKKKSDGNIFSEGYVYFVNSYYAVPEDKTIVAATSDYYGRFTGAVSFRNVTDVQFHPEKSGDFGLKLLRRWLQCWQKE